MIDLWIVHYQYPFDNDNGFWIESMSHGSPGMWFEIVDMNIYCVSRLCFSDTVREQRHFDTVRVIEVCAFVPDM